MRRPAVAVLVAFGLLAAGCSGADGQRAQELLLQAEAAEKNVRSATFELELNATFEGQKVGASLRGGGYSKGKRAGDMFLLGTVGSRNLGSAAFLELARYVKSVRVTEGQIVNGEPTATISGTIDTAGLVQGVAKLEGLSELAGGAAPDLSQLSKYLGDTRAAIAISERTHLIRGAVVNLTVDAEGRKVDLQLVYRLRDVNRPVRFPSGS